LQFGLDSQSFGNCIGLERDDEKDDMKTTNVSRIDPLLPKNIVITENHAAKLG
jgi:hypothetical protein